MDSHDQCYRNNTTGRPPLNISKVQLSVLLELEFTQVEIAKIFGCSSKTIHRRVLQFGLDQFTSYSAISDEKLDEVVLNFVSNFPTSGQKQLAGHLTSLGYRIQRYRIRDSLYRVDPWGVQIRSRRLLNCRKYKVAGTDCERLDDCVNKLKFCNPPPHPSLSSWSQLFHCYDSLN